MEEKNRIIRHFNKENGVTYLYWGRSVYVPGQKHPDVVKRCIGKLDVGGEFEPNKTFLSFGPEEQMATGLVEEPYYAAYTRGDRDVYESKMYGFIALLEGAARQTGALQSLKRVFPNDWRMMMTIVEAMMSDPGRALYRPKHFHDVCWHTYIDMPTEHSITKALEAADPASIQRFFTDFERRRAKGGLDMIEEMLVLALDTTSISTYSAMLEAAKWGRNKEGDELQQINLLMICSIKSGIPLYYRPLGGNTAEARSLEGTLADLKGAEFRKGAMVVTDRGMYSMANVVLLLRSGFRFLVGLPSTTSLWREAVAEAEPAILDTANLCPLWDVYGWTKGIEVEAPRRGRGPNAHPVCLYLFLNPAKRRDEQLAQSKQFAKDKERLEADPSLWKKGNRYGKYFTLARDAKGKVIGVEHNDEAQRARIAECGYFGFIGTPGLVADDVLRFTRSRDYIEKDYEAYKSRMRRPRHSLDEHLEAKIFLVFISTILEMWIKRRMDEHLLWGQYDFKSLRDEVFNAKWHKKAGKTFNEGTWGELTNKTQKIFHIMGTVKDSLLDAGIPAEVRLDLQKKRKKLGLPPA